MTDPLAPWPDDPRRGFPTGAARVGRELLGALLVLVGVIALVWVLATVDWRLPVGVAAVAAIAGGIYLGRDEPGADLEES